MKYEVGSMKKKNASYFILHTYFRCYEIHADSYSGALFSCGNNSEYPKAENALDAGREFIAACLKGDFKRANVYMLHNSANEQLLQKAEKDWSDKNPSYQNHYKTASINIENIDVVTDSITIINYKNSLINRP